VSESLIEPTDLETDIYSRLASMLRAAWKRRVSLRLVSLKLSNVYDGCFRSELALDVPAQCQDAQERLAVVIDGLRRAGGHSVILRGHDFRLREPPQELVATVAPTRRQPTVQKPTARPAAVGNYVPLRVHSHYSFLDSTMSPSAIVALAKQHGMSAVALSDTGNLHGAVEFVLAAKQAGIKPILGVEINLEKGPLLLYVESAPGYRNLNRLLSRHAELAATDADEASVANQQRGPYNRKELHGFTEGLIAVSEDSRLAEMFPGRFYNLIAGKRPGTTTPRSVACPNIRYATAADRQKFDIVQSIRTLTLLQENHPEKRRGGRFDFRSPAEMATCGWWKMRRSRKSSRPSRCGSYRFSIKQWSRRRDRSPIVLRARSVGSSCRGAGYWVKCGRCLRQPGAGSDDEDRRPVAFRSPFRTPVTPPAAEWDCRARVRDVDVLYGNTRNKIREFVADAVR
jgi:hypothetical protein